MLDAQQISDIIEVIDECTFKRPIYAGSCIATVKSNDEIKGYGHHRHVNIEIPPFNLTNVYKVIDDHDRKLNIYKIQ